MTTGEFLSLFKNPKKTTNGWQAKCPGHDDRHASLSIAEGDKGIVLKCQAGCETKTIVTALGLKLSDLFTTPPKAHSDRATAKNGTQKRRIVATYPYTDEAGQLLFEAVRYDPKDFRQRQPDGKGGWQWNLQGIQPVLYRLPELLKAVKKGVTIFLPEGERDVDNLRALGLAATCNPMGAGKWRAEYNEVLRGAHVVILPDNDKAGRDHAEALAKALTGIAASVKILMLPDLPDKGDVSDWLTTGGDAASLRALAANAPKREAAENSGAVKKQKTTAGGVTFVADETGVKATDADGNSTVVCSPLWIEAITRDEHQGNYGRLLRFTDPDENEKRWAMPASLRSGDKAAYEGYLLDQGVDIFHSKHLHTYLASKSKQRVLVVARTGWHRNSFVFADECLGSDDGEGIYHQSPEGGNYLMRTAGTLADWRKNVARYCVRNSRLLLTVSTGFAAALLAKLNIESGGFHLRTDTTKGKTTALLVGGSVWGGGSDKGFLRRWRATINGLESVAASHNDALLCLDELAEVDPRDAGETAYMLANGQGKLRQTKAITLRRPLEWRILFLSSGEISLAEHMSTVNKRIRGGMEVRLIHLPAEAGQGLGLFEYLHEFKSGKEFSEHLQEASKTYYGTASRAFIKSIIEQPLETLRTAWRDFKTSFFKTYCPSDAKEEVGRACDRFALVAFAGEQATKAGITGWEEGEATTGIAQFFKEWLAMRGTGRTDEEAALQQVRLFLEQHSDSRFRRLGGGDERTIMNQAGYIERNEGGEIESYYVLPEVFRVEVCKGYDVKQVAKTLQERKWLRATHDLRCEKRTPEGKKKFYAITQEIFGE